MGTQKFDGIAVAADREKQANREQHVSIGAKVFLYDVSAQPTIQAPLRNSRDYSDTVLDVGKIFVVCVYVISIKCDKAP
jgi:hypothetical protein